MPPQSLEKGSDRCRRFLVVLGLVLGPVLYPPVRAPASTLLALVDTGELFASQDAGANWTGHSVLPVRDAVGLIAGSSEAELFLLSTTGTLFRSLDGGLSWSARGSVPGYDCADLSGHPDGSLWVVARSGTVWRSPDQGVSFMAVGSVSASNVVSLVVGFNGTLASLTQTGEVSESADGGVTWIVVGTIPVPDAVSIRSFQGRLVAMTATGLTFVSLDQGFTWEPVGTVSQIGMTGITQLAGELVTVSREGLVARSADGASWTWVGAVNQLNVMALANDSPTATAAPENPSPITPLFLSQPWPNPLSRGPLNVAFSLERSAGVTVSLFDGLGRRVAGTPPTHFHKGGPHTLAWNPGMLRPGVYFLRLTTTQGQSEGRRITVLR